MPKFCLCYTLDQGAWIISITSTLYNCWKLGYTIFCLLFVAQDDTKYYSIPLRVMYMILLSIYFGDIVINFLFFIGVLFKRRLCLVPWLVMMFFESFGNLVAGCICVADVSGHRCSHYFEIFVVFLYLWIVILMYYQALCYTEENESIYT